MKCIQDTDVQGKRVLVRVDFNVPVQDGHVTDDTRVRAALPTISYLISHGAKTILMSHLGRPKGTGFESDLSLRPVAQVLAELLGQPVAFATDTIDDDAQDKIASENNGDVVLLENLRFDKREKQNDAEFASDLASLADIYVNDAFGTAHRAHASTVGVTQFLPSYAGMLMQKEVSTLSKMLDHPAHPFTAVLGGSKASDKIAVVDALLDKADTILIGGGMCFTFLAAQGLSIGKSLCEPDLVDSCKQMITKAQRLNKKLVLPKDVVVAPKVDPSASTHVVSVDTIPDDEMGLDIGPATCDEYASYIKESKTVFWNGPMGVFEMKPFEAGTRAIADAMAQTSATTVIGGGDSVAAVNKFDVAPKMTFISTGGGASMQLVEGKTLPGVTPLLQ